MTPPQGQGKTLGRPAPRGRWLAAAALLLAAAGAFAVRDPFFLRPEEGARAALTDADALYHFRVARLILHDWPRVPGFDSFLDFPRGAEIPWPFLPDLAAATVAKLAGGGERALEAVSFHYPPFLAALSLFPVFFLARSLGLPRWGGVAAAILFSLVPAQIRYTQVGMSDHHAADSFTLLLFLCAATWAWRAREAPLSSPRGWGPPAALAASSAAMLLTWPGAVIYPPLLLAAGGLEALRGRRDPGAPRFLLRAAAGMAGGGAVVAFSFLAAYGAGRLGRVDVDIPGGFHPLVLGGAAAGLAAMAVAAERGDGRFLRDPRFLGAVAAVAAVSALLGAPVLKASWVFLGKGTPAIRTIVEYLPVFTDRGGGHDLGRALADGVRLLSGGIFLLPFFLLLLWRSPRSSGPDQAFPRLLATVVSAAFLLLVIGQRRYGVVFALPCAVGSAFLLVSGWEEAGDRGAGAFRRARGAGVAALVAAAFLPGASFALDLLRVPGLTAFHPGIGPTLSWIRSRTPSPGDPMRPDLPPSWGVLAPWELGHHLVAVAERPAIAGPFIDTLPGDGFARAARAFAETDPELLYRFMTENRLRCLLLSDPWPDIQMGWLMEGRTAPPPPGSPPPVVLSLWQRLGSASPPGDAGGTRHFRLLWQDEGAPRGQGPPSAYQLYEAVAGARLAGTSRPGARVTSSLALLVQGRFPAVYREGVRADAAGRFSLTVPYSSESPAGETLPAGRWEVAVEGEAAPRRATVTEEDVVLGRVVEVP